VVRGLGHSIFSDRLTRIFHNDFELSQRNIRFALGKSPDKSARQGEYFTRALVKYSG
jgi:hypothetical protein